MGTCHSKPESDRVKRDKNHNRQKMFRFGVSFGRNDLNLEGHVYRGTPRPRERFENANICISPTLQETVGSHIKPSLPVVVMATLN